MKSAKTRSAKDILFYICIVILSLLTILGIIKSVFISFDVDEAYAIAQSYRMTLGDRILLDLWEPHQFSGYFSATLIKLFTLFTKSTDGIVIFLRVSGILIHGGLGAFLYTTLRKSFQKNVCLLVLLLHLNFLAKWIAMPEFELMCYWYLILSGLCFIKYFQGKQNILWMILSGVLFILQMLNYPTMAILFPAYIAGIIILSKKYSVKPLKAVMAYGVTALSSGVLFLVYLFSYMDFSTFKYNLSHMMADPSHTARTFNQRMLDFTFEFLVDLSIFAGIFAVCFLLAFLIRKITQKAGKGKFAKNLLYFRIPETAICLGITGLCIYQAVSCLFFDQNQFFLQERYLFTTISAIILFVIKKKKKTQTDFLLFFSLLLPSVVALIGSLLLTNMSVNVSYTRLFPVTLVLFLYMEKPFTLMVHNKKQSENGQTTFDANRILVSISAFAMIASLILCKLVLIRVTGCNNVTIKAPLTQVVNGPLKGVYILEEYASPWESDCILLQNNTTKDDNLFIFGCENLLYLCSDASVSVASVQGTSVFDQNFLDYFEEHPEKYPTVVAVDHRFTEVEVYRYNPYNYIVADWISKEFQYDEIIEGDYMTLYIKK